MAKEFAKSFYKSKEWKRCRQAYIDSVFALCERCNRPGYILHHKVKLNHMNINNPNITLNWDNLEYLCLECHNKEHNFEREKKACTKKEYKFNSRGELEPNPPMK